MNSSVVSPPTFSGLSKPGSVNWPMFVIDSSAPSFTVWFGGTVSVGATLFTVTWNVAVVMPPSSSLTVTVTV